MSAVLSPLISEFETTEQADSYTKWLQAKVKTNLADKRAPMPHDLVMAEMDAVIEEVESLRRA